MPFIVNEGILREEMNMNKVEWRYNKRIERHSLWIKEPLLKNFSLSRNLNQAYTFETHKFQSSIVTMGPIQYHILGCYENLIIHTYVILMRGIFLFHNTICNFQCLNSRSRYAGQYHCNQWARLLRQMNQLLPFSHS